MIKIQKEDFNSEEEINKIKNLYTNVGAVTSFIGYVRDINNNKKVKSINLEVYKKMAYKQFEKIINETNLKWDLIDCLIISPVILVGNFIILSLKNCTSHRPIWK